MLHSPNLIRELAETQAKIEAENQAILQAAHRLTAKTFTTFSGYALAREAGISARGEDAENIVARLVDSGHLTRSALEYRRYRLADASISFGAAKA